MRRPKIVAAQPFCDSRTPYIPDALGWPATPIDFLLQSYDVSPRLEELASSLHCMSVGDPKVEVRARPC